MKDGNNQRVSTDKASSDDIVATINNWKNAQAFGVRDYVERKVINDIQITLDNNATPIRFIVTDDEPWLIIARPELNLEYHFDEINIARLLSTKHDEIVVDEGQ